MIAPSSRGVSFNTAQVTAGIAAASSTTSAKPLHSASILKPSPPSKPPAYVATSKTGSKPVLETPAPVEFLTQIFRNTEEGRRILEHRGRRFVFFSPEASATDAYDLEAVRAIRTSDIDRLKELLAEGRSLDACNQFGESLVHMACRRGNVAVVDFLVNTARVSGDVKDDFGRTPLHDACWTPTPNLAVMDVLLKAVSPQLLLVEDVRGHTPFHYARKEHAGVWLQFLKERSDLIKRRLRVVAGEISS